LRTKDSTDEQNQLGQAMPEVKPVERKALVLVSAQTKLSSLKQEFHRDHGGHKESSRRRPLHG
jgi:hypothetical protein